jgi:HSP20 family molecular chaperone IbpA
MHRVLARWDPFTELSELRSRLDRMFDDRPWFEGRERAWMPAIDVVRGDGNLILRADVPGMKPEEVKIEVEDDVLTISGQHEEHYVRHERRCGSFSRSMALPRRRRRRADQGDHARRRGRSDDSAPSGGPRRRRSRSPRRPADSSP